MTPALMALFGLVAGLIFGLAVAYSIIGGIGLVIGMAVLLIGAFFPSLFRGFFAVALLGFLVSWLVYGGLGML